jgi:carboxylesterase
MQNPTLHNPHLEGEAFFWEGGPVGALLSHGYTATTAEVRLLAKRLHKEGYAVAAPLLAGHGTKPEDLNRVRWGDWVESAEKSYAQLSARCEKIFLGGQSMGGLVALYLASRHPEAAGVLLYAPAIRLALSPLDKIKLYAGSLFISQVPRASLDVSEKWQGYPNLPLKGAVQLLKFQSAVKRILREIRQPILVLQGRKDQTVHPAAGELILQNAGSALKELHWLERSSHPILIDCELEQAADLTLRFMQKALKM